MLSCVVPPQDGMTSLHFASQNGHEEIADLLIEKGARIDAQTKVRTLLGD